MKFHIIALMILLSFTSISCFDESVEQDSFSDTSSSAESDETGLSTEWINSIGIEFVWVEPGVFTMGSPTTDNNRDSDEGPQHSVALSKGFWIGRFEVTQGEWQRVMGQDPLKVRGTLNDKDWVDIWFVRLAGMV